ncbi:MAG TPA: phosphomannomutase/phosphoglucomutase [Candidatus Sulfotelmatobacter sp.]|jgi:phosphomannomutase|nr:phosphomannomutase/phosphoglucomutase [Candidatus Sulfotelmatobacter sp.]
MNDIDPQIFKAYDIRGIYPSQVDEHGADRIARAIYTFFKQKLGKDSFTILLAKDMRISSPVMFEAAKKALIEMGANVVDAGLLSTPTFYFAVYHYKYDTGIQITASHNPKEYTGMKFVINSPKGIIKIGKSTGMDDVKEMALGEMIFTPAQTPGIVTQLSDVGVQEIENALKIFKNPTIDTFKIVADPANAMGITYLSEAEKKIPMNLIKMNFTLDGTFPVHQPDPLQLENLVDLQKRVLEEKANLGLAPDGDGDRLMFIDEKGELVPPSIISAIVARELLREYPGEKIVIDIRYLLTPKKIIEESGGKFVDVRVGHAFITQKMQETGAIFGGESSGHYYFRDNGGTESQVPVLLCVLKVMTDEKKKLSEITEELRRSYESGEFNFRVSNTQEIMNSVKEKYKDGTITSIDCIEIAYPSWRFSVRTSNTEPLLRLNVESFTKEEMETKRDELMAIIKNLAKK